MVTIPTKNIASFKQTVKLDNENYVLIFNHNTRTDSWTVSFERTDGTSIVAGLGVVLNYDMITPFRAYDLPPGQLWAVDTTGEIDKIGRDQLELVDIVYIPEAEV